MSCLDSLPCGHCPRCVNDLHERLASADARERELLDRIRALADRNDALEAKLRLAFASMRLCVIGHAVDIEMIESDTITDEQATKILRDAGLSDADVDAAYERLMAAVDAKFPKEST